VAVGPVAGVPVSWPTEITHVLEGKLFVEEMRDLVTYALPAGGAVAHRWMVAPRLKQIFDIRRELPTRTPGEPT
jgi:hypothetical protein